VYGRRPLGADGPPDPSPGILLAVLPLGLASRQTAAEPRSAGQKHQHRWNFDVSAVLLATADHAWQAEPDGMVFAEAAMSTEPVMIWGGGVFVFRDAAQWVQVLSLARAFGWEPAGTEAPCDIAIDVWDGRYAPSDAQEITQEDALALADALDRAVDDIPDVAVRRNATPGIRANLLEAFAGNKRLLRRFIRHCRRSAPFFIC